MSLMVIEESIIFLWYFVNYLCSVPTENVFKKKFLKQVIQVITYNCTQLLTTVYTKKTFLNLFKKQLYLIK